MKAMVQDTYGAAAVLEARDIDKPQIGEGQVLVRVRAAGVNIADWAVMSGLPYIARPVYGLRRPKHAVRGTDVAGVVEAVGTGVTRFKPGDEVFGWCTGSFADYAAASEDGLALKPANLTFEQAAAVPMAGLVALLALRDHGKVQPGQKVLVNGAAGGIGTFAVQIAKSMGAEVTGVCSTRNVELVRSIGADHVIDYTQDDFTKSGEQYDFILDNVANHSLTELRRVLTADRHARAQWRRLPAPLDGQRRAAGQGGRHVPLRRPEARELPAGAEARRPARAQGPHRGRQGHPRDGPCLRAERDARGHRPRRDGACPGQGRDHRVAVVPRWSTVTRAPALPAVA